MFHNALFLAIIINVSLKSINRLTFVMTKHCVYCEVQLNWYILFRRNLSSRSWMNINRKDPLLSTTHKWRGGIGDGFNEAPLLVWRASSILMLSPVMSLSGSSLFRSYLYTRNIVFFYLEPAQNTDWMSFSQCRNRTNNLWQWHITK